MMSGAVMYEGHIKVTESNLAIGLALIDVDVQLSSQFILSVMSSIFRVTFLFVVFIFSQGGYFYTATPLNFYFSCFIAA